MTTGTGGTGGSGGAIGTGGTGGTGPASSSSSSSSTGTGGSGPAEATILLLAGGGATVLAGEYHQTGGWKTTTLTDATTDGPAVALTSPTTGVGMIRSTTASELRYATWTPGNWSAFSAVAAGVTTRSTPAIVASGGAANVVFQKSDFKHYFAARQAAWSPTSEPVGLGAAQSFGPSPASITAVGTSLVIAYAGDNHDVFDQTRTGGVWAAANGHGLGDTTLRTPALAALTATGPELLVVYVTSTNTIWYQTRTAGAWSPTAAVAGNAKSGDPVALTTTTTGAVMVFRGEDTKLYWLRYTSSIPGWNSVQQVVAGANVLTTSTPTLAPGIDGLDAELVFVESGAGAAKHTRLTGMTWSAPVAIGGAGLTRVGIASAPAAL